MLGKHSCGQGMSNKEIRIAQDQPQLEAGPATFQPPPPPATEVLALLKGLFKVLLSSTDANMNSKQHERDTRELLKKKKKFYKAVLNIKLQHGPESTDLISFIYSDLQNSCRHEHLALMAKE